ncbi:MAG: aa3-type cytochrome oxidase subunit CtaJ [Jatrophihabitans sp.]|uniref:aa3-type cytochrome oxidase subunit CtaJ n=1 Tax=Jatrophihabitans sp. TaxID=1932789 RepID=UPI003F7D97BA
MTVWQTIGVFGGIPLGIIALITLAVYAKDLTRSPNRYRPGKPWNFAPAWFVPHPDAVVQTVPTNRQLEGVVASSTTAVGGASGEW